VLFVGGMHGNEALTSTLLLLFIEELCQKLNQNTLISGIEFSRVLQNRSLLFVPLSNPDGCEIALKGENAFFENIQEIKQMCKGDFSSWKANSRGVDINRNFRTGWEEAKKISNQRGIIGPTFGKYGGEYPESEAETVALVNLCEKLKPRMLLTLHTQGEVIYYGWQDAINTHKRIAEIFSMLSGYALEEPEEISFGGGFKDWFVSRFSMPGFTIECGKGTNPLPPSKIMPIYKRLFEMLCIATIL